MKMSFDRPPEERKSDQVVPLKFGDASRQEDCPEGIRTLSDALLMLPGDDEVVLPDSRLSVGLAGLRDLIWRMFKLTPQQFAALPGLRRDKLTDKLRRNIEREFKKQFPEQWQRYESGGSAVIENLIDPVSVQRREERHVLHLWLRKWAAGPLTMERPQGSSYHHFMQYDIEVADHGAMTMEQINKIRGEPQIIVVENDWFRALAGKGIETGTVRLPFPRACWEFRISGVRVFGMTHVDEKTHDTYLFCVYGRDGVWVADDYIYVIGEDSGALVGRPHAYEGERLVERHELKPEHMNNSCEFRRVADLVWNQIRASCILLDVQATRMEHAAPPQKLVEKRHADRKQPPRSHVVVRLNREAHHRYNVARSRGAGVSGDRAAQRGHLRRGTWVHFDDQDSGEVQYINGGGFWVSKTWRRWHWAGDLSNMIEREYRL